MRTVNGEGAHSTPYKLHAFSIVPPLPPGEGQGVRLRRASLRLSRHPLKYPETPLANPRPAGSCKIGAPFSVYIYRTKKVLTAGSLEEMGLA
jgi:hypothetical protein